MHINASIYIDHVQLGDLASTYQAIGLTSCCCTSKEYAKRSACDDATRRVAGIVESGKEDMLCIVRVQVGIRMCAGVLCQE